MQLSRRTGHHRDWPPCSMAAVPGEFLCDPAAVAGKRTGIIHPFPTRPGGSLPARLMVMGGEACVPPQAYAAPADSQGRRDQEKTCPPDAMVFCWGTSHFPDITGVQVTVSSWWSPWALRAFWKTASGCRHGPAAGLGQWELPAAAGSGLPAPGAELGRQSPSFKPSIRLSLRKVPGGTE